MSHCTIVLLFVTLVFVSAQFDVTNPPATFIGLTELPRIEYIYGSKADNTSQIPSLSIGVNQVALLALYRTFVKAYLLNEPTHIIAFDYTGIFEITEALNQERKLVPKAPDMITDYSSNLPGLMDAGYALALDDILYEFFTSTGKTMEDLLPSFILDDIRSANGSYVSWPIISDIRSYNMNFTTLRRKNLPYPPPYKTTYYSDTPWNVYNTLVEFLDDLPNYNWSYSSVDRNYSYDYYEGKKWWSRDDWITTSVRAADSPDQSIITTQPCMTFSYLDGIMQECANIPIVKPGRIAGWSNPLAHACIKKWIYPLIKGREKNLEEMLDSNLGKVKEFIDTPWGQWNISDHISMPRPTCIVPSKALVGGPLLRGGSEIKRVVSPGDWTIFQHFGIIINPHSPNLINAKKFLFFFMNLTNNDGTPNQNLVNAYLAISRVPIIKGAENIPVFANILSAASAQSATSIGVIEATKARSTFAPLKFQPGMGDYEPKLNIHTVPLTIMAFHKDPAGDDATIARALSFVSDIVESNLQPCSATDTTNIVTCHNTALPYYTIVFKVWDRSKVGITCQITRQSINMLEDLNVQLVNQTNLQITGELTMQMYVTGNIPTDTTDVCDELDPTPKIGDTVTVILAPVNVAITSIIVIVGTWISLTTIEQVMLKHLEKDRWIYVTTIVLGTTNWVYLLLLTSAITFSTTETSYNIGLVISSFPIILVTTYGALTLAVQARQSLITSNKEGGSTLKDVPVTKVTTRLCCYQLHLNHLMTFICLSAGIITLGLLVSYIMIIEGLRTAVAYHYNVGMLICGTVLLWGGEVFVMYIHTFVIHPISRYFGGSVLHLLSLGALAVLATREYSATVISFSANTPLISSQVMLILGLICEATVCFLATQHNNSKLNKTLISANSANNELTKYIAQLKDTAILNKVRDEFYRLAIYSEPG